MVIQGFDQTKFTFHQTLFVDRLLFQALVWYSTSEPKWVVSCQLTVLNSGYWPDRSIGQLTHIGIGCLSLIYTVSLDVIGNVDSRNEYTMNSKQKESGDHYKVSESIVADGIVG